MARKTDGTTTARRTKKTEIPVASVVSDATPEPPGDLRKNATSRVSQAVDLNEEIRRRAYELYLQRAATTGGSYGDPNQDWLVAEREVLSLHGGQKQHSA